MKYTHSQSLPKHFYRNFWLITEKAGKQQAQHYADIVSAGRIVDQKLFDYKGCEVYYDGFVYAKYHWVVKGYDPDYNNLCGRQDSIEHILSDIDEIMDN